MGVTANFGIKTDVDDAALKTLVDHLKSIPEHAKKISDIFKTVASEVVSGAERMSKSAVDADGKIVQSKIVSSDKVRAEINKLIVAAESAADREVASAKAAEQKLVQIKNDEVNKIIGLAEQKTQREIASEQKAEEKLAAIAAKEEKRQRSAAEKEAARLAVAEAKQEAARQKAEERAKAADQKKQEREAAAAAKSKGRTVAELEELLHLKDKSKKEIIALEKSLSEEVAETAKKLTLTLDGEEKKRLKQTQAELKSELAAVKQEAEERGVAAKPKGMDREREFSGKGLAQVAGIGIAVEGLSTLVEKSKEVVAAQHQLQVGTGLAGESLAKAGEEAEKLGDRLGVSGDEAKTTMGKVASYTHATGEELNKQTEAVLAYAQAHGKSAEMVAKQLATDSGRANIFAEAVENVGKAQDAANDPAIRAQLTQQKLEETAGELASTLLSGLAPILTQLSPLIGTLGGIVTDILTPALKVVAVVLTPVIDTLNTLKPILPYLVGALGILAVALNATAIAEWALNAAMAVNPFVWIAIGVAALIVIVVQMVKHWDEVVAAMKKVFSAIMDAGGAVLSFLGITSKAEAATKKHTKSIEENKKSLEDIKKATDDAAKATADYTDSLKKNQEEQDKSAKEGQDNAIAAIVDIQQKLKTATGSEKAVLEERLQQWQSYGKKQVANAEAIETAQHAASLSIGAAADKEDQSGAKKAAKSKEDIAKESADSLLNAKKESIAAEKVTDAQKHVEEVNAEIAHAEALLKVALDFHGAKSAQYKSEENKLTILRNTLQKDSRAALLDSMKSETDDALALLEQKGIREVLTDRQINAERFIIEHDALQKEIDQRKSWGEDVSKLQLQLGTMELKNDAEVRKQKLEDEKQEQAVKLQLEKENVDREKDGVQKEHDLADLKYRDELSALREQLENKKLTVAQYDALALAAQRKNAEESDAIDQKARDEKEQRAQQAFSDGIDFAQKSGKEQTKIAKDFLVKEVQQFITSQAAKIVAGNAAQAEQTALVAAGFVARQATYVAESVASAASAAGTWIATAAKAVFNAFESLPFPLDIVAAVAAVGGVVALATQVPKMFGGHEMGTQSSPGGMKWVGERGPELMNVPHGAQVIPNHRIVHAGAQTVDLSPLISRLDSIHRATVQASGTFAKRPAPVLAVNTPLISLMNIAAKNDARSSI